MKRDGVDKGIFLIAAIVVVLVGVGLLIATYVRTDVISELAEDGEQIPLLIVLELPDNALISQVLYFDSGTNRAALFDVPSSTGVVVESLNRVDGIDTVYWNDGIEPFQDAVATLLGAPVTYYLVMDLDGLETLTDLIEGVPLFVADIPDEGPDAIRMATGDVILDGAKMQSYVTFSPEGERDRERIARHQKSVMGLVSRMGEQRELIAEPAVSSILSNAVETNLDRRAFISLANVLAGLEVDRVITRQVEGTVRQVETADETEELLFPHQEGRWLTESVRQVVENLKSDEALRDENIVIRLEILNGTANTGLARRTAELYRSYGFDVVTVGNALRDDVGETVIIDRVGNELFANRTAEIIRASLIDLQVETQVGVDVTVILGEDFDGRYVR